MNGEVIKSFLVGLGFGVDESSLAKFNKSLASASLRVTALYASVKIAAAGIVYGISEISEGFEKMGYEYRIIAPAINKALQLRQELLKAYSAAGINITKVIQNSVRLNLSLAKTKFAFQAIYQSVASRFFTLLTKQSDLFRQKIYANMPKIQAALERMIKFVFKALEATTTLGARLWSILMRVYDFFVLLDKATGGWSTRILAVIAAWKILNLGFLATPLGMLLTGFVALLALWDDFKTFKEGGESLIDWGSRTTQVMVGVATAILAVAAAVGSVIAALRIYAVVQGVINALLLLNPFTIWIVAITALIGLVGLLIAKWNTLKQGLSGFKEVGASIGDFFAGLGGRVLDFAGGSSPVGNAAQNTANTNQHVAQQTTINVSGSADAASVGRAVSGEQSRVNFDMVRNMKGAVR